MLEERTTLNRPATRNLFLLAGVSGIVGTCCYVLAITVPMNQTVSFVVAMAWPILSIIFVFGLVRFIALTDAGFSNQLAGIFAYLAFALVAAMMSIQFAIELGTGTNIANSSANQQELLGMIKRSVRLVDMGLDVAWDLFIGTSLIFLAVAIRRHRNFGIWWSIPAGLLAILLIVLNCITFPWPPDTRGLFDVGPAIGLYIIAISGRLLFIAVRMKGGSREETDSVTSV